MSAREEGGGRVKGVRGRRPELLVGVMGGSPGPKVGEGVVGGVNILGKVDLVEPGEISVVQPRSV